jgi:hypothetical protein
MNTLEQLEAVRETLRDPAHFVATRFDTGDRCCIMGALNRTWPGAMAIHPEHRMIFEDLSRSSAAWRLLQRVTLEISAELRRLKVDGNLPTGNPEILAHDGHLIVMLMLNRAISLAGGEDKAIADEAERIAEGEPEKTASYATSIS